MFSIKIFIKNKLKSILSELALENNIFPNTICNIHNSVTYSATSFKGTISIDKKSKIYNARFNGDIKLNNDVKVHDAIMNGKISIGEKSKIIDGVGLYGQIEIGNYTTINGPNTELRCALNKISIGNFCSIARNVTFQEYNHNYKMLTTYMVRLNIENKKFEDDIVSKGAITIEHDVWIGTECVILSGVTIGTGAVIAANSVVVTNIPPYAIAAGSPAKVIKFRFNKETVSELLESKWWNLKQSEIVSYFNEFESRK